MLPKQRNKWLVRLVCLAGTLIWIVVLAADPALLERIELAALDTEMRLSSHHKPSHDIVIAAMDEHAVHLYGPLPWGAPRVAEALAALESYQPRVVALDVVLTGERDGGPDGAKISPEYWQSLVQVMQKSGNVVLGSFFDFGAEMEHGAASEHMDPGILFRARAVRQMRYVAGASPSAADRPPVPVSDSVHSSAAELLTPAREAGHLNLVPSRDGMVRWVPLVVRYREDLYSAFAVETARAALGDAGLEVVLGRQRVEGLRVGAQMVPTDEHGQLLVRFAGGRATFPTYSLADIVDRRVPSEALRNRIVLVGSTAAGNADVWATPLDPLLPGVEIHANVVDNVLRGDFLVRNWLTRLMTFVVVVVLCFAAILLLPRARGMGIKRLSFAAAASLSLFIAGHFIFFTQTGYATSLLLPFMSLGTMFAGAIAVNYFTEEKERLQIEGCFEHYLDKEIISGLMDHPELLRLGGERREMTVLFCDIRGFTTMAERIPAELTVEILNEFFTSMTEIVFATGGMVDKFVGDQIMAVWGAPVERADHAEAACEAALKMAEEFHRLSDRWSQLLPAAPEPSLKGGPAQKTVMRCGIGINSGAMVVGNIGSKRRFSYTVIGDNVNIGARLEALNKTYGTRILAGPATFLAARQKFSFRQVDEVQVRGRKGAIGVYELLSEGSDGRASQEWLAAFAEGYREYRSKQWQPALDAFSKALSINPDDACAQFYLASAREFQQSGRGQA